MKGSVVFLTESGDRIGWGHLMRVSVLIDAFERRGIRCHLMLDHHGDQPPELPGTVERIDWRGQLADGLEGSPTVAVVDSYLATQDEIVQLDRWAETSVAIDDYDRMDYPTDFVLNPNPFFVENVEDRLKRFERVGCRTKKGMPGKKPIAIGGADWVLIRGPIRSGRSCFRVQAGCRRVTITVGGSDHHRLLPQLVDRVVDRFEAIRVVAGSNDAANRLEGMKLSSHVEVSRFLDAGAMRDCMVGSDLVISACGQTLHELAFLGVPTIGIRIGEDQRPNQAFYFEQKFLLAELDWQAPDWRQKLNREIERMASEKVRRGVSERGRQLIDGEGAERLVRLLFPEEAPGR